MTKHYFEMPKLGKMTSIVMEQKEFEELLELVKNNFMIPLVKNGPKTKFMFDKYEIETEYASFCVRGLAAKMGGQAMAIFKNAYKSLPEEKRNLIDNYVQKVLDNLKEWNNKKYECPKVNPLDIIDEYLNAICPKYPIDQNWFKHFKEQNFTSFVDTCNRNAKIYEKNPQALKEYLGRLFVGSYVAISAAPRDPTNN